MHVRSFCFLSLSPFLSPPLSSKLTLSSNEKLHSIYLKVVVVARVDLIRIKEVHDEVLHHFNGCLFGVQPLVSSQTSNAFMLGLQRKREKKTQQLLLVCPWFYCFFP